MYCAPVRAELSEMVADLSEVFPSLYRGWLPRHQIKEALERAGFPISGGEYRRLVEDGFMRPGCDHICVDTLMAILNTLRCNQEKQQIIDKKNELRERADLRVSRFFVPLSGGMMPLVAPFLSQSFNPTDSGYIHL